MFWSGRVFEIEKLTWFFPAFGDDEGTGSSIFKTFLFASDQEYRTAEKML